MTIIDQSYQPWSGDFQPRWRRIAAMARIGVRQAFGGTVMRVVMFLVYGTMCAMMGIIFILSSLRKPPAFVQGNFMFRVFLGNVFPTGILVMILAALVGARLISRDLRHNAVAMYFSKAITRGDYLLGKFATLAAFLLAATLAPATLPWIGQWSVSKEVVGAGARLLDLAAIAGHSAAIVVPCAMYVLALSSLSRTAFVPAIMWVMTYIGSLAVSEILIETVKEDWCKLLSWPRLVMRIGELCYPDRQPKSGGPFDVQVFSPPLSMEYGWLPPLAILGGITVLSAAVVLWRLRKFEGQE